MTLADQLIARTATQLDQLQAQLMNELRANRDHVPGATVARVVVQVQGMRDLLRLVGTSSAKLDPGRPDC